MRYNAACLFIFVVSSNLLDPNDLFDPSKSDLGKLLIKVM